VNGCLHRDSGSQLSALGSWLHHAWIRFLSRYGI
jgi:hypothetical protein